MQRKRERMNRVEMCLETRVKQHKNCLKKKFENHIHKRQGLCLNFLDTYSNVTFVDNESTKKIGANRSI